MIWLPRYRLIEHTVRIFQYLIFRSALSMVNRFSRKRLEKILFLSYEVSANDWTQQAQLICFSSKRDWPKLSSRRNVFQTSGAALLKT